MPAICLPGDDSNNGSNLQRFDYDGHSMAPDAHYDVSVLKKDAQTQKDDSELSTTSTSDTVTNRLTSRKIVQSKTPGVKRRAATRSRVSRSISPSTRGNGKSNGHLVRIQPAIPANANIRSILENVAKTEGAFSNPDEALKAAIAAFHQDAWTTKVEGMLAITRLATYHPNILQKEMHIVTGALVYEVKNLRSTVARSAIFTIGELFVKMRKQAETVS